MKKPYKPVINEKVLKKRAQKKFHLPIIATYPNGKKIRYNSILDAEMDLGIPYHMIFDAAIGRIRKAGGAYWEYENGRYWLKYRTQYIRNVRKYTRYIGFNG